MRKCKRTDRFFAVDTKLAKYQDKVHAKQFDDDWLGLKKQPLDIFVAVVVVDAVVFVVVAVVVVMADIIKLTLFLMLFLNTFIANHLTLWYTKALINSKYL